MKSIAEQPMEIWFGLGPFGLGFCFVLLKISAEKNVFLQEGPKIGPKKKETLPTIIGVLCII